MPARAQLPRSADVMAELLETIHGMAPAKRAIFLASLPPDDKAMVERAYSIHQQAGFRANPATLMHQLTRGERKLWPYVELLARCWAGAFMGTMNPHQLWNLPSQYGKTTGVMDGLLWALDFDPRLRLMYVTYDDNKAQELGGDVRDLAEVYSSELRFRLRPDRRARGQWRTEQGGGLYCVGIWGAITGYPADALVGDDLLKGDQVAHSEAQRAAVHAVYRTQMRLRVQSGACPIILPGTRWHEDDLTARLMKEAELHPETADQWLHIRLPAVAEEPQPDHPDPTLRTPDALGRPVGQVLEAERFSPEEVRARATALGPYAAAALEQQRPAPEEGTIILREWLKLAPQLPPKPDQWLSSWDMKLKDKEAGDFVVGQVWCRTGADMWLCDQLRGQWNQEQTILAICLLSLRWPLVRSHIIENTGNGPEVMAALRSAAPTYELSEELASQLGMNAAERVAVELLRRKGMPGLIPNTPKGPKPVRARAVVPYLAAGNVHINANASWVQGYVTELTAFPNGTHDDQVDATSQALVRLAKGPAVATPAPAGPVPGVPLSGRGSLGPGARAGVLRGGGPGSSGGSGGGLRPRRG